MSKRPTKVQRLVRWNQFREDVAGDALRRTLADETRAREEHESANADLNKLGALKTRSLAGGALDLSFYQTVLEVERLAMSRTYDLLTALHTCEERSQQAQNALHAAASASRVSRKRDERERHAREAETEKRTFDQIADVWAGNRGGSND